MNKENFIEELSKATGLDHRDCVIVNDILESHFIVGKKNKEKMIFDIAEKLHLSKERAENIYDSAMSIIGTGVIDKLKHPFKSRD